MSEYLDENRIAAIQAVSNADGKTLLSVQANPANYSLKVDDDTTGTDKGGNPDPRDGDRKVAFYAVSAVDGETPVAVYVDSTTKKLLVTSV